MTDATHLCLTCKLAEWKRTITGRLHPSGDGKCGWKPPHIPIPAAMYWIGRQLDGSPSPTGGYINRTMVDTITECETYERAP